MKLGAAAWLPLMIRLTAVGCANRPFLDFDLIANAADFAVMLVMAVTMSDERQHIAGVLALRRGLHRPAGGMLAADPPRPR